MKHLFVLTTAILFLSFSSQSSFAVKTGTMISVKEIGSISPEDATAIWWDLQRQAKEVFHGKFEYTFGDSSQSLVAGKLYVRIPFFGKDIQESVFEVTKNADDDFTINQQSVSMWKIAAGFVGKVRFYKVGKKTTMQVVNTYTTEKTPLWLIRLMSKMGASSQASRYRHLKNATKEEIQNLRKALEK